MDASGGLGLPPIVMRAGNGSTGRPVPWAGEFDGPSDPSLVGLPAAEIAARVRSGEITAVDVVRAHLDHIEAVDGRIGAFRVVRREAALAEAAAVDASLTRFALPLAGVPVAIKDNVAVAGETCTDGSPPRRGEP